MSSHQEVAHQIETFIRERFQVSPDDEHFSRSVNLWEGGYVDSLGFVDLIVHIETTFKARLPDDALFSVDFTTIDGIAALVSRLVAEPEA